MARINAECKIEPLIITPACVLRNYWVKYNYSLNLFRLRRWTPDPEVRHHYCCPRQYMSAASAKCYVGLLLKFDVKIDMYVPCDKFRRKHWKCVRYRENHRKRPPSAKSYNILGNIGFVGLH